MGLSVLSSCHRSSSLLRTSRSLHQYIRRAMATTSPKSTSFELTHRVSFPSGWPNSGVSAEDHATGRLPNPQYTITPERNVVFKPTHELYVGGSKWSQVYRGTLSSTSPTSDSGGPDSDCVLKVYDQRLFPGSGGEEVSENIPWSTGSYRCTEELMAWTETWAFGQLASAQGREIPRFFGTFKVKTSNTEALGVAMTYVEGIPIIERCQQLGSDVDGDSRCYALLRSFFKIVYEFHRLNVCALDIRDSNVLVCPSSDSVTLFDFAFSRPCSFANAADNELHRADAARERDITDLMQLSGEIFGDSMDEYKPGYAQRRWAFIQWIREKHSDDVWVEPWRSKIDMWKL